MTYLLFPPNHKNPRLLALQVLVDSESQHIYAQDLLDSYLDRSFLQPLDRKLTFQLVYGVIRRKGTLDYLLKKAVAREPDNVEPWLWQCLRLGAYQISFLTHVPIHAALFETVELATQVGKSRAKGFINGVLRKIVSFFTPEFTSQISPSALPLESGTCRQLTGIFLPDPKKQPVEFLAVAFSWPNWLAGRWLDRYGWEEAVRLGYWFNATPPLHLRTNLLKTTRENFLEKLKQEKIGADPGEHPQSVRFKEHFPITQLPGFSDGYFTVQDESAMGVASALNPGPGEKVLDFCAAPGGKTTHLAELMENRGSILACDIDADRLSSVSQLANRLGISIIQPVELPPHGKPPQGPFDAILVDVPCSNTGVLGRRPEVRWRLTPNQIPHLAKLQTQLLTMAMGLVKPAGKVVYSTCSIEPEENQKVIQALLKEFPDFILDQDHSFIPGKPADGGYWARLVRKN